jgi:preprotein translocase subunit SecE
MPAAVTKTGSDIRSTFRSIAEFLTSVRSELRKVTWPDRAQLKQSTIAVIVFVLIIAGFIALLDVILQAVLVAGVPSLFK